MHNMEHSQELRRLRILSTLMSCFNEMLLDEYHLDEWHLDSLRLTVSALNVTLLLLSSRALPIESIGWSVSLTTA